MFLPFYAGFYFFRVFSLETIQKSMV